MSSPETRSQLLTDILSRAARDRAFRIQLLTEPAAAIHAGFGVQVPDGYRIKFIERGSDVDALIVLPDPEAGGELSDAELEEVAGGTIPEPNPTWRI